MTRADQQTNRIFRFIGQLCVSCKEGGYGGKCRREWERIGGEETVSGKFTSNVVVIGERGTYPRRA